MKIILKDRQLSLTEFMDYSSSPNTQSYESSDPLQKIKATLKERYVNMREQLAKMELQKEYIRRARLNERRYHDL